MRLARDEVRTQWFPAGTCIVEQGEPADALYLILNGTADALLEHPDGQLTHMRRMQAGDFFGELGLVAGAGERTAHVVASESLTCLLLSRTPISQYAGRGAGATRTAEPPAADVPRGVCAVDVTSHLHRKLAALARHRTQYPIVPSMLPQSLLQSMLGTEFFRRTADGSEPGQSPVAALWRPARRSISTTTQAAPSRSSRTCRGTASPSWLPFHLDGLPTRAAHHLGQPP